MTKRNEKTGKKVASKAGKLMEDIGYQLESTELMFVQLNSIADTLNLAKSVAASALTQATDKPLKNK